METADIVIVGAGASGLAFAWRLAGAGLNVLCLERGAAFDHAQAGSLSEDWELLLQRRMHGNPNIRRGPADPPVDERDTPIKPSFFTAVGGGTIRWGAHFPRLRPSDFRMRSLDGVGADWPISYWDLEPYYDLNDRMMGVSGLAGDPSNPPRAPRPCPPLPLCPGSERLAAAFDRLGWAWWPSDAAIISRGDGGSRRGCNHCGPCGVGCPRRARASADIAYLPGARAGGLRLETGATALGLDFQGDRVQAVRFVDQAGRARRVAAAEIVLAANGLCTPHLLLASRAPLPEPLLGRGLMLHPTAIVTGVFAEDLKTWRGAFAASLCCQEFYETDRSRGFVRGFQLQALRGQGPVGAALGGYTGRLDWGAGHHRRFVESFGRTISLTVTCDDLPEPENRIDLAPGARDRFGAPIARMRYRVGENSQRMLDFGVQRATEALRAAGAVRIAVTPLVRQGGFHLMGAARMGADPETSVVDASGRAHGLRNLTVIDGSVFATAGAVNPTATIQAFALKAASDMARRLGAGTEARAA